MKPRRTAENKELTPIRKQLVFRSNKRQGKTIFLYDFLTFRNNGAYTRQIRHLHAQVRLTRSDPSAITQRQDVLKRVTERLTNITHHRKETHFRTPTITIQANPQ